MKTGTKRAWLAVATVCFCGAVSALAQGFTHTYSLFGGSVGITNSQANSSWVVSSVMFLYAAPSTGTAEVSRVSQGVSVLLARRVFTNVTALVWVPEGPYSYGYGDSMLVSSTPTNGVLQVIRRGD